MMLKTGASVAVLTLLLGATAAMCANNDAATAASADGALATEVPKAPVAGQIVVQDANTVLAKELIGQTVYAPDKAKIGSISDLILSKDAKTVEGFVIGVGGFLGIGEKSVAHEAGSPPDRRTTPQSGGLQLMMDAKKEELANTPSFKSKRDQDAERQAAERARNMPQGGPANPRQN